MIFFSLGIQFYFNFTYIFKFYCIKTFKYIFLAIIWAIRTKSVILKDYLFPLDLHEIQFEPRKLRLIAK